MNAKLVAGLILVLLGLAILPTSASAIDAPYFAGWGGWGLYPTVPYALGSNQLPYYALYPPVYYSQPVARPYGYSPFAYPPGVPTPSSDGPAVSVPQPCPRIVINPYVTQPAP